MAITFRKEVSIYNDSDGSTQQVKLGDVATLPTVQVGSVLLAVFTFQRTDDITEPAIVTKDQDPAGNSWSRVQQSYANNLSPSIANESQQTELWQVLVETPYAASDEISWTLGSTGITSITAHLTEWSGMDINTFQDSTTSTDSGIVSPTDRNISNDGTIISPISGGNVLLFSAIGLETNQAGMPVDTGWTGIPEVFDPPQSGIRNNSLLHEAYIFGQADLSYDTTDQGTANAYQWAGILAQFTPTPVVDESPGNPHADCFLGPEVLALENRQVPVDQGTAYLFNFETNVSSSGEDHEIVAEFVPQAVRQQHMVAFEVYQPGQESIRDEEIELIFPVSAVRLGADATVTAGTPLDALSAYGTNQVVLDGTLTDPSVFMQFDMSQLNGYETWRVLELSMSVLAWKSAGDPPEPGQGLTYGLFNTSSTEVDFSESYSAVLFTDYETDSQIKPLSYGETDRFQYEPNTIAEQWFKTPFWVGNLKRFDDADPSLETYLFGTPSPINNVGTTFVDYVELRVRLTRERRTSVAYRLVSNLIQTSTLNFTTDWVNQVEWRYSLNPKLTIQPGDNAPLVLSIREALPCTPASILRLEPSIFQFSFMEAIGPSLKLKAVETARPSLAPEIGLRRQTISDQRPSSQPIQLPNTNLAVVCYDSNSELTIGGDWASYSQMAGPGQQFVGTPEAINPTTYTQYVNILPPSASTTYDKIKVLCRPGIFINVSTLDISIEQPQNTQIATATITPNDALQAPARGNWFEVTVPLSAPITPNLTDAIYVEYTSTAGPGAAWLVASVEPVGKKYYFGYNPNDNTRSDDIPTVLICQATAPTISASISAQPIERPAAACSATSVECVQVTWDNPSGYDRFELTRTIGSNSRKVADLNGATLSYLDCGAPWDQSSVSYSITGFRDETQVGISSTTAAVVTPGPVSPGNGTVGFFNPDNGAYLLYTPVSANDLEVEWTSLNPITLVPLHGVDYATVLRAPEERGLTTQWSVVVNNFSLCTNVSISNRRGIPEIVSAGAQSITPTPFDPIRDLDRSEYVVLQLPGGHTRDITVDVGGMRISTVVGLYMTQLTLTDVNPAVIRG